MIKVNKIPNKGRGVIATQDIAKGTLLEVAPVAVIPFEEEHNKNKMNIFKYYFVNPLEYRQGKVDKLYLVFGLASLCNHSENPNARVDWSEDEIGSWSHLIAQKDIKESEEITLFYTNIEEYADAEKFV